MISRIEEAESLSEFLISHEVPLLENSDPLRIILHTSKFGLSGIEVDKKFIQKRIIGELAEPGTLTFCLGFSSHKRLGKRFLRIWEAAQGVGPMAVDVGIPAREYSHFHQNGNFFRRIS